MDPHLSASSEDLSTVGGWLHYWAAFVLAVGAGAVSGVFASWRGFADLVHRVNALETDMRDVRPRLKRIEDDHSRLDVIESEVNGLKPRLTAIENAVADMPRRGEVLEFRREMAGRFTDITNLVNSLLQRTNAAGN